MKSRAQFTRRIEDGHVVVGLRDGAVAVEMVPSLGARLLSLRDLRAGREWLWRAGDGRGLFACGSDTPFELSPLAGVDECLPTVVPCRLDGIDLPDHGECWSQPWTWDEKAAAEGVLDASLDLPRSGLRLRRLLDLENGGVRLEYVLENRASEPRLWIYAFHALFPIEPADRVELPGDAAGPACAEGAHAKAFISAAGGRAQAHIRRADGAVLELSWDGEALPWLAVWITRGAWFGHRHLALEPTNAPADSPLEPGASQLAPGGKVSWCVALRPC